MKLLFKIFVIIFILSNQTIAKDIMIMKLKSGDVKIELFAYIAPNHV